MILKLNITLTCQWIKAIKHNFITMHLTCLGELFILVMIILNFNHGFMV
jgi:fumarate reductase subunit D